MPPAVTAAFNSTLNTLVGASAAELYISNPAKLWFQLACGLHNKFCTTQAMCRLVNGQAADFRPKCQICSPARNSSQEASSIELEARQAVQKLLAEGTSGMQHPGLAVEVRLLKEQREQRYAAADVLVYCFRQGQLVVLLVQVDGSQHFDNAFTGSSVAEQQAKDEKYNLAVLEQGYHCVRLHYADAETGQYGSLIEEGLRTALGGSQPFILYSMSYPHLPRGQIKAYRYKVSSP